MTGEAGMTYSEGVVLDRWGRRPYPAPLFTRRHYESSQQPEGRQDAR
jgi:hypothetical protein